MIISARPGLVLALVIGTGLLLTACANTANESLATPSANPGSAQSASSKPTREPNTDITAQQQAFLDDLLAAPLPLSEVQERIQVAGYMSRVVEIDGEPQAVTMDYRLDRVNLITNDGLVTDAYWG